MLQQLEILSSRQEADLRLEAPTQKNRERLVFVYNQLNRFGGKRLSVMAIRVTIVHDVAQNYFHNNVSELKKEFYLVVRAY